MFSKSYEVDPKHIDFQGVMDGLYYPFYFEWARHDYLYEEMGVDIEQLFEQGQMYVVLEYNLKYRKSVRAGETVVVTCEAEKHAKPNRINMVQKMFLGETVAAEAVFTCTCLYHGRPTIPKAFLSSLDVK